MPVPEPLFSSLSSPVFASCRPPLPSFPLSCPLFLAARELIAGFQAMYPDTEIRYETGEENLSVSEQIDTLTARLTAGTGPDILILDGLPAESCQAEGLFADLTPALAGIQDELQQNILSAYTTEEGIYMLPIRYSVPVAVVNQRNVNAVNSLRDLMISASRCGNGYSRDDFLEMIFYNYILRSVPQKEAIFAALRPLKSSILCSGMKVSSL